MHMTPRIMKFDVCAASHSFNIMLEQADTEYISDTLGGKVFFS